jgi:type IV secretory pathway VirB10-like protein
MDTTLDSKQTDPRHALMASADEELAHAYEQITSAGEQIARAEEQLSKLEHAARRAVPGKRPLFGGRAVRGSIGLALAACIGVAAIAWQSPYGDAAKPTIARWAPQLVLATSLALEKPGFSAQPNLPAVQAAAAKTAPLQPAPPAQVAAEDVVPTAAALSPELTQLLQSMARDLATLGQAIEQLKASQERMARDHVNAVDLLRASQEQMARVIAKTSEAKASEAKASEAKASEQNLRPRISAPPPWPTVAPPRKPVPTL